MPLCSPTRTLQIHIAMQSHVHIPFGVDFGQIWDLGRWGNTLPWKNPEILQKGGGELKRGRLELTALLFKKKVGMGGLKSTAPNRQLTKSSIDDCVS